MLKFSLRAIFWILLIILLSILVPSFFANQFPSYFKALSIYYDSLFGAYFKLPGAKSLFSLIVLLNLSLSSAALFMAILNNLGADASRAQISPHNAPGITLTRILKRIPLPNLQFIPST